MIILLYLYNYTFEHLKRRFICSNNNKFKIIKKNIYNYKCLLI